MTILHDIAVALTVSFWVVVSVGTIACGVIITRKGWWF